MSSVPALCIDRFRHHSLNEQLRVICQIIPGCDVKVRETKVLHPHMEMYYGLSPHSTLSSVTPSFTLVF